MAIALRGTATAHNELNPTTTFTHTVDANVLADDLLFVTVTSRDSTAGSSDVTCTDDDTGGNSWSVLTNTADKKAWVFWKRATSGTASKTITVANCVGSASGVLKAFSGADTGATPYTDTATETNAAGDETHAGITPTGADSMVCAVIVNIDNNNNVTLLSFATLGATTMTEALSTGGLDCSVAFGHALQAGGSAATGGLTWTQNDFATYSIVFAIKILSVGGGDPEGSLVAGKLLRGGLLLHGVLGR